MKLYKIPHILFGLLVFISGAWAQTEMTEFVCGKGRFAISVPRATPERKDLNYALADIALEGESITWRGGDGTYTEIQYYYVYGAGLKPTAKENSAVLQEHKNVFLQAVKNAGIMTSESPYVFDGFQGVEIRGIGGGRLVTRYLFTKSRFVVISTAIRGADNFDANLKILDSFRFLTKPEYSAALISENTPEPLPQTPNLQRPQADARQDGLKGRVRDVITDIQYTPASERERESEDLYDGAGNLVRSIFFHFGYPSDLSQWGWIDGARVERSRHITYGSNEGPNEKQLTEFTMVNPGATENVKKRDDRYSHKHEYKYDPSGRLTEKVTSENDGTLSTRKVYTYKANQREAITYDEKGSMNSKLLETFDASGNVIEERRYDFKGKLESVILLKYQFDAAGNWLVRKDFSKRVVKGKSVLKAGAISYRKITYY